MTRICLIAGNFSEAKKFASSQNWSSQQWFYPMDERDLLANSNFHVLVVGTAGENVPASWFNRFYNLALIRGRVDRDS